MNTPPNLLIPRASVSALGALGVPMPAATAARREYLEAEPRYGAGAGTAANT
ncbi:MAG TPA: hypothetical protein VKG05_13140 [Steroidobacteraceae bacterium]|nr:hypothetical protein [Steroidobacteraceae bacterium]